MGKTIECGLVLCQLWSERKRNLLVICPATLRKQWQLELREKFNLPAEILDKKRLRDLAQEGKTPLSVSGIKILSYPFAAKQKDWLREVPWDAACFDECHKLKNSHRESNKVGQALRWALAGRKKILLSATPLQNSLAELYGVSTLIDENMFGGDFSAFRTRFMNTGGDIDALRERLADFCNRTLRKDVLEYVRYTRRFPITISFESSDPEFRLYEELSRYLQDENTYAFPEKQRHLLVMVVRKLLASSGAALLGTLEKILIRLESLKTKNKPNDDDALREILEGESDILEELEDESDEEEIGSEETNSDTETQSVDYKRLEAEIALVRGFISKLQSLGTESKAKNLLLALNQGWSKLAELGAEQKAVIFTESRRSMLSLQSFLEANGYAGETVCFSGNNSGAREREIYENFCREHPEEAKSAGKAVAFRHALIEHFRSRAKILIATEAGAEGLNLQFCSMVVNYDLPWNPQRVEQRIGRCHRYGQKFDVVVVNFLNTRNAADVRVFDLLSEKLKLFEGIFGASNDVLGVLDNGGISFERRIYEILQKCRSAEEIDGARVHFKLVKADTAKDNIKDSEAVRCFVLWNPESAPATDAEATEENEDAEAAVPAPEYPSDFLEEKSGELFIYFQYLKFPKSTKQATFTAEAVEKIAAKLGEKQLSQKFSLLAPAPTTGNKNRTRLEKELTRYTAKNTSDYFIHKDLKTFLTRELDFYIKNEMLHLDDIQNAEAFRQIEAGLRQIQTVRTIALELIAFMAQLENFQKKLWLKKKFVVRADYCLTLDRVPAKFYEEIFANEAQLAEWEKLGFGKSGFQPLQSVCENDSDKAVKNRFSQNELFPESTSAEISGKYDSRMVDTKFFPPEFKEKLLAEIDELDESCDGLLIRSENFQALNFLRERYREKIKCIYIDPPYNTDATPIIYKNGYKESTWIALMSERLISGESFLNLHSGYYSVAIDDVELHNLALLMKSLFPERELLQVIVNHYPGSGTGRSNVSKTHEYNLFSIPRGVDILRGKEKPARERARGFCRSGTGDNNYRTGRPNSFYAVLVDTDKHKIVGFEEPPPLGESYPVGVNEKGFLRVYPIGANGAERCWSLGYDSAKNAWKAGDLVCSENNVISRLYHDEKSRDLLPSLWVDSKYSASTNGTNLLTALLGQSGLFQFPKSIYTVREAVFSGTFSDPDSTILDYFAGSGTTGHAVINLNREDGGKRKYILVEMGDHFETVLKPRIEKVVYSPNWKDGKPLDSDKGVSHCFKYLTLESYEDTLNNLQLSAAGNVPALLRDEYLLHYMLDVESRGSLLSTDDFKKPFDYALDIATDSSGATAKTPIDLVETFNYLLGLTVKKIDSKRKQKDGFVTVEGILPSGEEALIFWRDCEKIDNAKLNEILKSRSLNPNNSEFAVYYVNGDHAVENISVGADGNEKRKKVLQIEDEFLKKMFEE